MSADSDQGQRHRRAGAGTHGQAPGSPHQVVRDPWWNPAAENQATDRAHRIGQTKHVFFYKLIAAGSIEEKILALQERKAALADSILSDDAAALGKFSEVDIAALLAPLPI